MEELLTASSIVVTVARYFGIDPTDMFRKMQSGYHEDEVYLSAFRVAISIIYSRTCLSLTELGVILDHHHTTIHWHSEHMSPSEASLAKRLMEEHRWPCIMSIQNSGDAAPLRLTLSFAGKLVTKPAPNAVLRLSRRRVPKTRFERVDPLSELPDNILDVISGKQE